MSGVTAEDPPALAPRSAVSARAAQAELVVGLAYAAISAYWAAGGMGLLVTVGGAFESWGRTGGVGVRALLGAVVAAKVVAAVLPVMAVHPRLSSRIVRWLAWADGLILTAYGGILTAVGLAIQSGVIAAGAHADHQALTWHAYLWDPWFLVWGALILLALRRDPGRG